MPSSKAIISVMRLLNCHSLTFVEFPNPPHDATPPYAVASHRWRSDEATFKDISKRRNTTSSGYRKVLSFCQYIKDNIPRIEWLWIDTWYAAAEICLVWLWDVAGPALPEHGSVSTKQQVLKENWRHSEWFRRGWTLQELLAPRWVVFLNFEWNIIGHKGPFDEETVAGNFGHVGNSLDEDLAQVTRIPVAVLRHYQCSKNLGFEEKMQWMQGRETTKGEDMWYSLFGIFGVAPGANYGEGEGNAKRKLLRAIAEIDEDAHTQAPGSRGLKRKAYFDEPARVDPHYRTTKDAVNSLMDSLRFHLLDARQSQITGAHHGTYLWSLLAFTSAPGKWDNIVEWLGAERPPSNIYWISAKPGAGKSSLMKFLNEQLTTEHMRPWVKGSELVRIAHYFWISGSDLQKSLTGLMRTALLELLRQLPDDMINHVPEHIWRLACALNPNGPMISWTDSELRVFLANALRTITQSCKVVFIVDGLDELGGDDDAREALIEFVQDITSCPGIKMLISSRRWTIFYDAFSGCPQLRLEDLNYEDIHSFVREELRAQPRFLQMLDHDSHAASLIAVVTSRAEGVFLWAHLVVRELVRGIRDGDSYSTLLQHVYSVPPDLDKYFGKILGSIEVHHRKQACMIFLLALKADEQEKMDDYVDDKLQLIDLLFLDIASSNPDFVLHPFTDRQLFSNPLALVHRLNGLLRVLSSRCKDLLDCFYLKRSSGVSLMDGFLPDPRYYSDNFKETSAEEARISFEKQRRKSTTEGDITLAGCFVVDFMHRTLHDFLLEETFQQFANEHFATAPVATSDLEFFLASTKVAQVLMLQHASSRNCHTWKTELADSLIYGALLSPEDPRWVGLFKVLETAADFLTSAPDPNARIMAGYTSAEWHSEGTDFVSLAVQSEFTTFLDQNLTAAHVHNKTGRPPLDYALRRKDSSSPVSSRVRQLLEYGADPNAQWHGHSIFANFLSHIGVVGYGVSDIEECIASISLMLDWGANLSMCAYCVGAECHDLHPEAWPVPWKRVAAKDGKVAVVDILEYLRPQLGNGVDGLQDMATNRAAQQTERRQTSNSVSGTMTLQYAASAPGMPTASKRGISVEALLCA
ncbi:unnamed protein product [Zymoseptoria tritici ST99CH_3D1]|nr:unnamed protein product [Zymoseptoria tritici ST99CH_3D1]